MVFSDASNWLISWTLPHVPKERLNETVMRWPCDSHEKHSLVDRSDRYLYYIYNASKMPITVAILSQFSQIHGPWAEQRSNPPPCQHPVYLSIALLVVLDAKNGWGARSLERCRSCNKHSLEELLWQLQKRHPISKTRELGWLPKQRKAEIITALECIGSICFFLFSFVVVLPCRRLFTESHPLAAKEIGCIQLAEPLLHTKICLHGRPSNR